MKNRPMKNQPRSTGKPARLFALATLAVCAAIHSSAQGPVKAIPVPTPPMGWSSWNSFSNTIDSGIVMAQAKAMVSTGMARAGYQYINIDEGWWLGDRDKNGNIVVPAKAWPAIAPGEQAGDMSNIVRFIHAQGLKAGIYTDAGLDGCSTVGPDLGPSYPHTGSEGHYEQDFLQFARWGFDYVKVDWCGGDKEHLKAAVQYAQIAQAIAHAESITGHHLYFSICNWGVQNPWTWAPNVGGVAADIWRTGGDIVAPIVANTKNADRKAAFKEVLREFDQAQHPEAQHSGFYNDPDMMVVGMPGLNEAENRAHMSLWAISGGPLLVGADLTRLTPTDLNTLTNADVIRIDQDSLGLQSIKVAEPAPGLQVWSKPMSTTGERAVLLLNRTAAPAAIPVRWTDLGLTNDEASVRDIWAQKDLGELPVSYSATVPPNDIVLLTVVGSEAPATAYFPDEPKPTPTTPAITSPSISASPSAGTTLPSSTSVPTSPAVAANSSPTKDKQVTFTHISSRFPIARIRITYTNPDSTPRFAELQINSGTASSSITKISFPPTGTSTGILSIQSHLDTQGPTNTLIFARPAESTPTESMPAIQSISLQ
jgi:hypothetical protein